MGDVDTTIQSNDQRSINVQQIIEIYSKSVTIDFREDFGLPTSTIPNMDQDNHVYITQ